MFPRLFGKPRPTPEEAFQDKVVAELSSRDLGLTKIERVEVMQLKLWDETGAMHQVFLDNAFLAYSKALLGSAQEADAYLNDYLATFKDFGNLPAFSPKTVIPAVRHFAYLGDNAEAIMTHLIETNDLPDGYEGRWAAPFLADLVFMLTAETEHAIAFANASDVAEFDISTGQALQAALTRFSQAGHKATITPINTDGMFVMQLTDARWATPLLLCTPQVFVQFMEDNGHEALLLTHPTREEIFFVASTEPEAEYLMLETLHMSRDSGHRQSDYVFQLDRGGQIEPILFLPEDGAAQRLDGALH